MKKAFLLLSLAALLLIPAMSFALPSGSSGDDTTLAMGRSANQQGSDTGTSRDRNVRQRDMRDSTSDTDMNRDTTRSRSPGMDTGTPGTTTSPGTSMPGGSSAPSSMGPGETSPGASSPGSTSPGAGGSTSGTGAGSGAGGAGGGASGGAGGR